MLQKIDYVLDRITMYRLVLYILIALVGIASILGDFSLVPYSPITIISSALILVGVGWIANTIFAWANDAPANIESFFITALILVLIMKPAQSLSDVPLLVWAIVLAMLSKYLLAINKKHLFNPAAIAAVITGFVLGHPASWWVGTAWMAPFVAISGLLIIRKLRFYDLAWGFFTTVLVVCTGFSIYHGDTFVKAITKVIFDSHMLFLGSIMVTEPLTMPPTKRLQMIYAAGIGLLCVPQLSFFGFTFSPELSLCVGNIFAYIVSPKWKLILTLSEKTQIAKDAMEFAFKIPQKFAYEPGQYMEWTLPHPHWDSRGNRRYFTLASSPTEKKLLLGVKLAHPGSSYKKALAEISDHTPIVAGQIAGDFTLPKERMQKIAFFAGGIGITPFRSMIKYLSDTGETRDIVLCYSNKTEDEIAYKDIFDEAHTKFGLKVVYTLTDLHNIPHGWKGETGRINADLIKREIPDFAERLFYLSGPQSMVNGYEKVLKNIGVHQNNIKKDFFPGLT
ncbi:MAG TPA: hypothetical protein VLF93_05340 [Candidatus Saccharimonadales bacterium]|nr:hypothetical protein [Candidatus Saccharimonadales bacterium]